ncbi:hypothetical protein RFM68_32355 [Mesorhizobium sp. MSK_1335]|uniref:N,N-dimethylformamidase alpha subunit domain-containing protein n=1 Tax=Mesorhizobium montanum TaxID=3072323 RepID=A0ABU4ZVV9_9HYPH|nr:hypothetical protein [Mesorhizobium sp. MSK_1335]MDX8529147.1 hypothetical protein [Mesorhizobium sp. MSK_1335]
MLRVDKGLAHLAQEYKSDPLNVFPRPDVQVLLRRLMVADARGHTVVVCLEPGKAWSLGRHGACLGDELELEGEIFDTLEAALWACFRVRWRALTGAECPVE